MDKIKLECVNVDTCLSDYWRGHSLPYLQVAVDRKTTLKQLKADLQSELFQDAMGGDLEGTETEEWNTAAIKAINAIKRANPKSRKPLFPGLDATTDEGYESVYAYFVFTDIS